MATNKFLTLISGIQNFVTAINASAGVADADKIIATDSTGKIANSLLPPGVGAETKTVLASENLTAGNWVNIYDNGGTENVRLADSSNQRFANGFVLAAVTTGNNAEVYVSGINNALTSLTPGSVMYLSTAGASTSSAPDTNTSGNLVQTLGTSLSATEVAFNFNGYTLVA